MEIAASEMRFERAAELRDALDHVVAEGEWNSRIAAEWWIGASGARTLGLILGGLLIGYAIVAGTLVRDTVAGPRASFGQRVAHQ
mgnify:CR=1 FL=1